MIDSVQISFSKVVLTTPASGRVLRNLCLGYIAAHQATPQPLLHGEWVVELGAKPNARYGLGRLWTLRHVKTGVRVGVDIISDEERVIYVAASLPRILFGANHHHLLHQADVDAALARLIEILAPIFDLAKASSHIRFKRLDLVRSLAVPLDAVKRTLRYARHPCSTEEPVVRRNSLHFNGTNTALFIYDKEKKEKLPGAGTRTRAEVRLMNKDKVAENAGLAGPGLSLNFERAHEVYRKVLGQLPSIKQVAKGGIYDFLAAVAASDRQYEGASLFDRYLEIVCRNEESRSRTRREVAKRVPTITGVNLEELAA